MLYRTVRNILYAILLTPLLIWSAFLFPFITTKALYFRLLVEAALFFYLILIWRYPAFRPRFNLLTGAVWFYMAVVLTAAAAGLDFRTSFMGTMERGEGIVTLLHFAVYFTMLTGVFRRPAEWYRYLLFAVSVTAAVAFYGLLQLTAASGVIHSGGTRISGTIGNAAFFAAYLLFGLFLSLYLQAAAPNFRHRLYLWLIFAFELAMLYRSETRGAILGLLAAAFLFLFFRLIRGPKRFLAGVFLAALLAGGWFVYLNRDVAWVQRQSALRRLTTISMNDITTQSRLDAWSASVRAFRDRPILGWGYENYNLAFNKYFPSRIYKDAGSQLWFDRAHNIVFDVGLTSGLLGLLAYFGIFAAAFRILWKNRGPLVLGLVLLVYFLQNLFVFDTHATYLMFFLALGRIGSLPAPATALAPAIASARSPAASRLRPAGGAAGIAIGAAALAFVAYFANLEPALANLQATAAVKLAAAGQATAAKAGFETALSHGTYMDREIRQRLLDSFSAIYQSPQLTGADRLAFFNFAEAQFRQSIAAAPRDAKQYMFLMSLLNGATPLEPAAAADEVLALGEKARPLSPTRPQLYVDFGRAYLNKKEYDSALREFRRAVVLAPQAAELRFNLALAAILAGQPEAAAEALAGLREIGYNLTAADHGFLASVYGRICELSAARREAEDAARLNPSMAAEVQDFLVQLENDCRK